jgi:hypothetical protein
MRGSITLQIGHQNQYKPCESRLCGRARAQIASLVIEFADLARY